MEHIETLTEALNYLKTEGYTEDFNIKENFLEYGSGKYKIFADEFKIDKVYRFEGMTDPADQSILYAISSDKNSVKGTLLNGYGIYTDSLTTKMTEKLRYNPNNIPS